jgi:hypothetical protein
MELTGEVCNVTPFLESYQPIQEIPVARCCTVWTDQNTSIEYLLVADQMLWFGTLLPNSLINPNQLRAYGISVNDDPFDTSRAFGIDSDTAVIPFDTTGTVVHFESRVPTDWEKTHLPIILLTGEDWNPTQEILRPGKHSRKAMEMRAIHSTTRRRVNAVAIDEAPVTLRGETEIQLGQISCIYNPKDLSEHLVATVNVATAYRADMDEWDEKKRSVSSIITNDRHSTVTPEDLARLWNVGLHTAKDTIHVTTQKGIRMAIHPMTRRVRVDHLHLHRQ